MKLLRHLALVALVSCAICAQAAPKASKPLTAEQACKDPHVQCLDKPIAISLRMPDGSTFTETLPAPNPLLQYDHLYLFPGQTLYIEADDDGAKLMNLRMVPANTHPEKTLVFKFQQRDTQGQYGMSLSIHNPLMHWLKYHAVVVDADTAGNTFKQSSTCPVVPGGDATESWVAPIFQVVLSDFHFLAQDDAKAKRRCIY